MTRQTLAKLTILSLLTLLTPALHAVAREPSTAAERAQALEYVHDLEINPLGGKAGRERQWLSEWIIAIPDIEVPVCTSLLADVSKTKKNQGDLVVAQMAYASAAFLIEHPGKKDDMPAIHQAGVEGSLRVYETLLKKSRKVDQKPLDDLLHARDAGTLTAALQKQSSGCMQ